MLASSSGNAALYGIQTWTFTDSRIDALHAYALAWGVSLTAPVAVVLTPTGTTLAAGSLIAPLNFGAAGCISLFSTSRTTRHGVAVLVDLTAKVELWRSPLDLAWSDQPAGWVAPSVSGDVYATLVEVAALIATHNAAASAHAATLAALTHASRHAAAGADPVTPAAIGVGAIGLLGTVQRTIRFSFGDAAALSSGMYAVVRALPFAFTPTKWTLTCSAADQKSAASAATVTIGLYVDDYAVGSLPTTSVGGTQPAVSAAIGAQSLTPGFTDTTWAKGQSVLAKIEAAPACTALWCDLEIEGTATE